MARLGSRVIMVGRVGGDDAGRHLRAELVAAGVNPAGVVIDQGARSGTALIFVAEDGENSIVVAPGANEMVSESDVEGMRWAIERAPVAVFQLEIPLEAVAAGIAMAQGTVVLNPAPTQRLPAEVLGGVDILVPNRGELGSLVGEPPAESFEELANQAANLDMRGSVVVTLGGDGCLVTSGRRYVHLPAESVVAVDTTGAGDAFIGALAVAISEGQELEAAAHFATRAAAVAIGRRGAQASLATRSDLP